MESSVVSAIEKIKLQEQDKEAKLKEKREYESAVYTLRKSIKETMTQAEKLKQEAVELIQRTDLLRSQIDIAKVNKNALTQQYESCTKEIEHLKITTDKGMSEVWELRSSLNECIKDVADSCDIWALLMKPTTVDIAPVSMQICPEEAPLVLVYEDRLNLAKQKVDKAITERDRLMIEPDNGDEFVRKLFLYRARNFSSKAEPGENEPVKFSTSPAAKRVVTPVLKRPSKSEAPWYQGFSVLASVSVFLVYFCILREESGIDQEFSKTLYDRIQGLEKFQLIQSYKFNKENGLSVEDIEKRLKELEKEEVISVA